MLPFGLTNVKLFGALAIIIAVGGYIGWLKLDIHNLETKVEEQQLEIRGLELDVEREKGNVRECMATIDGNNERINDLQQDNDRRTEILDSLNETIKEFKDINRIRVEDILSAPTPENCEQAMEFLRRGVGR